MTYVCLFEYFPITFASHQSSSVTFTEIYCNASLSCVKIEAAFTTKINVTVYNSGKNVVKTVRFASHIYFYYQNYCNITT